VTLVVALSTSSGMSGGLTMVAVVGAGAARGGVTAVAAVTAVVVRLVVGLVSVVRGHDRLAEGRDVSTGEVLEALPSL
jgi:hypothetical protein